MLPLLGGRLVEIAGDTLPAGFAERVAAARVRDRMRNIALQAQAAAAVDALAAAGVRALPLKGPGLAVRLHGDMGLRSPGDVDLLVAEADLHAAVRVLRRQGYEAPADVVDRRGLPRLHFTLRHPDLATAEVHRRVTWYEGRFSPDLLDRARPGADGLLEPDPLDDLAALLLFHARDGFYGLRLAADIGAWYDRHGGGRTGLLDGHAARYPELARIWLASAISLSRTLRIPVETWLGAPPAPTRRTELAVRLGTWSQRGDEAQLWANIVLVDGLLTRARSLDRFIMRVVTDDPEHVPSHLVKSAARFAAALWGVRNGPWDPVPQDL